MILPRDMYDSSPPARDKAQDNPTLLVSWWCTGFAVAIILVRIGGRYVRTERLFREDRIMALSLIPLLIRMGLVHLVLLWGTNNAITDGLSPSDLQHRDYGSRIVLGSRIMYAMFLWIAKFTITEFLKRLTSHVWKQSYERGLQFIRWFLIVTFVAVVVATLAECQPFNHYWQVAPDPGPKCRQGKAQLITMGASDIITDLLIVGFPIPIILKSTMAPKRRAALLKVSLVLLFALSLILVGITVYRVEGVMVRHSDQQFRSLVASLEILAAAAVANALVLGSFVRDRGVKKQRFRFGSTGGHSSLDRPNNAPRHALTARNWGSDADLVGDVGMRLDPELTGKPSDLPRPAPVALANGSTSKAVGPDMVDQNWVFPNRTLVGTAESDPDGPDTIPDFQPSPTADLPTTPPGMSFFDVGGLLGVKDSPPQGPPNVSKQPRRTALATAATLRPPLSPTSISEVRRGSHALLQDIGGLLSHSSQPAAPRPPTTGQSHDLIEALHSPPPTTSPTPLSPRPMKERVPRALQDVGGLLS